MSTQLLSRLAALSKLAALALPLAAAAQAPPAPATQRVVTLDEAVQTARARQPQLRQAQASSAAASARADQARAPLLPQLDGSASYQSSRSGATVVSAASGVRAGGESWSAGVTLSQTIFDLGTFSRARAAGASAAAQRETERATELDVVANARTFFFAARAARDLVAVARDTLANQEAHLKQVEAFVGVGTRPEIDLAQARADRANAEVQLIQAQNQYDVARTQLAQAMGLDGPSDFDVSDDALPPVPGEDGTLEPLLAGALAARPELASLSDQQRAQLLTRRAAQSGYLPSLGAQTGVGESGPRIDDTTWDWNAQVILSWNLFGGGLTRAQVREADANLDALAAQVDGLRLQVRVDVDQARLGVRASRAALGAADQALVNARERLRLAEGRYQAGAGSIIELGDAQVAATSAAAQRVQAEYDLASARARLLRALGQD